MDAPGTLPLFQEQFGMGLPILVHTVVSGFGGTVVVRIRDFLITFKRIGSRQIEELYRQHQNEFFIQSLSRKYKADELDTSDLRPINAVYSVKISQKMGGFDFCGNLVTVRIPLLGEPSR